MSRSDLNQISGFLAVARAQSFTKAAAVLGVSQSALSQTVRNLERQLGVRLLARNPRGVSPTEAGRRLLSAVGPRIEEIEEEIDTLKALRKRPAGSMRQVQPARRRSI
jgi:DNA-binding transcriptional LysR family regulator